MDVMIKLKNSERWTYANVVNYDFEDIFVQPYEGRNVKMKVFKLYFSDSSLDKTFSIGSIKWVKVKKGLFFRNIDIPRNIV